MENEIISCLPFLSFSFFSQTLECRLVFSFKLSMCAYEKQRQLVITCLSTARTKNWQYNFRNQCGMIDKANSKSTSQFCMVTSVRWSYTSQSSAQERGYITQTIDKIEVKR